ncbi:MAG: hypothetical protein ACOY40_18400 [Bacillota bacterium]
MIGGKGGVLIMVKFLVRAFIVCFCTASVGYWLYLLATLKFLQG